MKGALLDISHNNSNCHSKCVITQTEYFRSLDPWDVCYELFCIFGDFYVSGMQDIHVHVEVTKSL